MWQTGRISTIKLTLIAIGSRGDVQPIVALGKGLHNAGYGVRMVTLDSYEDFVRAQGLEFHPVYGDAQKLVQELMVSQRDRASLLRMYRGMLRSFGAITDSYVESFSAEILRDSDAILSQLPGGFYGYDLAEGLDVPYFALSVIPQEPTASYPFSMFPTRVSLGGWWNRRTYALAKQMAWHPFRNSINQFRKRLGLPKASFLWGNTQMKVPVLQGFSEQVIPRQPEWGEHVYTTGYWLLDEAEWKPSHELTDFLAAGDPPIFIGFGSMPVADPSYTTQLIVDALTVTGQRGILSAGWAELGSRPLPEHVFRLDYAPFEWLFPKMRGIIHHGGSGTTGLALRSGVPSLVIPFIADQPFWGSRTHALGVGPAPISFQKLTTERLAAAICELLENEKMQKRAVRLREQLIDENGVQNAVNIVQNILKNR